MSTYNEERRNRAQRRLGLTDLFSQLTGHLAQPMRLDEKLVYATNVSATNPANSTTRRYAELGPNGAGKYDFVMRDVASRIDMVIEAYLLGVHDRTIDGCSVLCRVLRESLQVYVELLHDTAFQARRALYPRRVTTNTYFRGRATRLNAELRYLKGLRSARASTPYDNQRLRAIEAHKAILNLEKVRLVRNAPTAPP